MTETNMKHMEHLQRIVDEDVAELAFKESTYQGSWKRRGGVGAAMMMLRKVDRLEVMVKAHSYDIFKAIEADVRAGADGTVLAEVRDLRRYLLLIEAEMRAQNKVFPVAMPKAEKVTEAEVLADLTEHSARVFPALERLDDGLHEPDIPSNARGWYMLSDAPNGLYIVDRRKAPRECWEHLPMLRTELNNKEHQETPTEYQGLYKWISNDSKWRMREHYAESWSKP